MLPLSLQSVIYSCACRTSQFLESLLTTQTATMLAYNTQQITKFLAIQACQMQHLTLRESITLVYLAIYSSFCAIVAMHVLPSITSSKQCGRNSLHAYLHKLCLPRDMIKCTKVCSPSSAGKGLNKFAFPDISGYSSVRGILCAWYS